MFGKNYRTPFLNKLSKLKISRSNSTNKEQNQASGKKPVTYEEIKSITESSLSIIEESEEKEINYDVNRKKSNVDFFDKY